MLFFIAFAALQSLAVIPRLPLQTTIRVITLFSTTFVEMSRKNIIFFMFLFAGKLPKNFRQKTFNDFSDEKFSISANND